MKSFIKLVKMWLPQLLYFPMKTDNTLMLQKLFKSKIMRVPTSCILLLKMKLSYSFCHVRSVTIFLTWQNKHP